MPAAYSPFEGEHLTHFGTRCLQVLCCYTHSPIPLSFFPRFRSSVHAVGLLPLLEFLWSRSSSPRPTLRVFLAQLATLLRLPFLRSLGVFAHALLPTPIVRTNLTPFPHHPSRAAFWQADPCRLSCLTLFRDFCCSDAKRGVLSAPVTSSSSRDATSPMRRTYRRTFQKVSLPPL